MWARIGWFAAFTYMGVIFVLSSVPGDDLPLPQFPFSDKIAHFVTYGLLGALIAFRAGLTALLRRAAPSPPSLHPQPLTRGGWIAPLVGIAYAAFDEFHQSFVPNRNMSLGDFVVDVIGLLLGFWLARTWDAARLRRARDHDHAPTQ